MGPISKIFIAYSREDDSYLTELRTHLSPIERTSNIKIWYDGKIEPGVVWESAIKKNLHEADIILLLLSASSLASDYFYEREVKDAIERHEQSTTKVIPIILRPCSWRATPLSRLQALPKDGKPISLWLDKDQAYNNIVDQIWSLINQNPSEEKTVKVNDLASSTNSNKTRYIESISNQEEKNKHIYKFKESSSYSLFDENKNNQLVSISLIIGIIGSIINILIHSIYLQAHFVGDQESYSNSQEILNKAYFYIVPFSFSIASMGIGILKNKFVILFFSLLFIVSNSIVILKEQNGSTFFIITYLLLLGSIIFFENKFRHVILIALVFVFFEITNEFILKLPFEYNFISRIMYSLIFIWYLYQLMINKKNSAPNKVQNVHST